MFMSGLVIRHGLIRGSPVLYPRSAPGRGSKLREHDEHKDPVAWSMSMFPTTSSVDLPDRDNKETLVVKEEETNDAGAFGEVVVDVAGSQKEPSSSVYCVLLLVVQIIARAASTCLRVEHRETSELDF